MLKKYTILLILILLYSHTSQAEEFNPSDTKKYLQQCSTENNADACYFSGKSFYTGIGKKQNYFKAFEAFKKACDLGSAPGCSNLGTMYIDALGIKADFNKAQQFSKIACNNNDLLGCFNLGKIYQYPNHQYRQNQNIKKDPIKAFQFYQRACNDNFHIACSYLGDMYKRGQGVKKNYSKAVELYLKSCDHGDFNGCRAIYKMHRSGQYKIKYENGLELKPNYSKAFGYFESSCNDGDLNKCAKLAWMHDLFNQDDEKETKLHKQTCKVGGLKSCYQLGLGYKLGSGVERDNKKFLKLHQKACDGGYRKACHSLEKYKTTTSKDNLNNLKEKCNQGSVDSCNQLGHAYNTLQNDVKAIKYYKQACDNGSKSGCTNYKFATKSPETKELDTLQSRIVFSTGKKQKAALKKIEQLANEGNQDAAYAMFEAYKYGLGVDQSKEKIEYWLNKSVELGSSEGMY